MRSLPLLVCFACAEPDPQPPESTSIGDADTDADSDADTDTVPPEVAVAATCDPTPNAQVFACAITLDTEGFAEVTFSAPDLPGHTYRSDEVGTEATVYAWGLLPDTTYDWDAVGVTGQVTTGPLPPALEGFSVERNGELFGADAVLVNVKCGYFVMVDSEGRVVWYQPTACDGFTDGMRWSQADRSVLCSVDAVISNDTTSFHEYHVSGAEVLTLRDTDLDLSLTHDVARWGDYTYLLGEGSDGTSGFAVFDGVSRVGQWKLTDAFPDLDDTFSPFVNSISVSDEGEVILSLLSNDEVLGVDGDPASPTFLARTFLADGAPGGRDLDEADYVTASGSSFEGQHAPNRVGDELWVFDNQSVAGHSRAVRLSMDQANGLLTELDAWELADTCLFQGGALPLDGGALVTCATSDEVSAFRDGADSPDWTMRAGCDGEAVGGSSTRAYPVRIE